jgi:hypothetical protein
MQSYIKIYEMRTGWHKNQGATFNYQQENFEIMESCILGFPSKSLF